MLADSERGIRVGAALIRARLAPRVHTNPSQFKSGALVRRLHPRTTNVAQLDDTRPRDGAASGCDLAALFGEHADGLAGAVRGVLGRGADVQEVLQEAFLRAWKARAAGRMPSEPVGWVFVVTLNLAKDLRRARRRRGASVPLEDVHSMKLQSNMASPHATLEGREAVDAARAAIHRLEDKLKEVFVLRVSAGLSFDAIADSLDIPVGTAKTRMRAALLQLRHRLAPHAAPEAGSES